MALSRIALVAAMTGALLGGIAEAATCPLDGQKPMLVVQLFFGQDVQGKPLSPAAWRKFLADEVTPRFPDGLTVFDAYGQWRAPGAAKVGRESSRVVEIATDDSAETEKRIAAIAAIYRKRFHQESVGIVTMPGCGAF